MKYLCLSKDLADHWYPKNDAKKQAEIDMYLHWHHNNIRQGAGGSIFRKFFYPALVGGNASQETIKEANIILEMSLNQIVSIWLPQNSNRKFLIGNQPTIADLSLAMELGQLEGIGYMETLKEKWPSIDKWLHESMRSVDGFSEVYDEGTKAIVKLISLIAKKRNLEAKL